MSKLKETRVIYPINGDNGPIDLDDVLKLGNTLKEARDDVNSVYEGLVLCSVSLIDTQFCVDFSQLVEGSNFAMAIKKYFDYAGVGYPDADYDARPVKEALNQTGKTLKKKFFGGYRIVDL
jgi:hypothetical protein